MKILFWNLNKKANDIFIKALLKEQDIDIAILGEYSGINITDVLRDIGDDYVWLDGYGGCEKVTMICKKTFYVAITREQSRYTLYTFEYKRAQYNIVGIHLPAPPASDANARKNVIRDIVGDINELEKNQKSNRTIVIGDFNCNPFDEEITQHDSFNAVLFKKLIEEKEYIMYSNKKYRRFYNPMIDYICEETETYGSIYYSSGSAPLYWNTFDQVLVRKAVINEVRNVTICKSIYDKSLIKRVKPDDAISDHLPLIVEIEKGD